MASAAAFRRSLGVFVDRTLSPAAQSARLAAVARQELERQIAAGRASRSFRRFVDGREGAAEETVGPAPHGQIVYRFNHLSAVVTFALSFLVNRSPMRSGTYRKSFYIGVSRSSSMQPEAGGPGRDRRGRFTAPASPTPAPIQGGKFIPMAQFSPAALTPDVTEIVIGNTQPYSRKVDVQLVGNQSLTFSVPPGLFDDAAAAVRARFGDLVEAKRIYTMQFPGQYILKREQVRRARNGTRISANRAGKRVESPALVITPRR